MPDESTATMISVEEAWKIIERCVVPLPLIQVDLADALDRPIGEAIVSPWDTPRHDKSMVDGYAVRAEDLDPLGTILEVLEEIMAGDVPRRELAPMTAAQVMTGAPLPQGTSAVVMIEDTQESSAQGMPRRVKINPLQLRLGANLLRQGCVIKAGTTIIPQGKRIGPAEISLLAEAGICRVLAPTLPRVAILPTGNELVPLGVQPGPGQIPNSNGPMLEAAVRTAGGIPVCLPIARDTVEEHRRLITRGLACDVLVLSGGVSAGVLDLVPKVLAELGVVPRFHKIRLKPGKPLFFGVLESRPIPKLVFGLPGNPVSSFVCFELFVRGALALLAGGSWSRDPRQGILNGPFSHRGNRPTFHPALVTPGVDRPRVEPLSWQGSSDMLALSKANALAHFPEGNRDYSRDEPVTFFPLDGIRRLGANGIAAG